MKGNPEIIADLNQLLKNELTAINQYFLHARMMNHWGFERLGKKIYEESIGEMKHADKLIKRILLLDGSWGALIAQVVKTAAHPVHTWLCELQRTLYQTLVLAAWLGAIE